MIKKITQKLDHMMMPTSVGTDSKRPVFDIWLGYLLIRDKSVCKSIKLKSLGIGWGIAVGLLMMEVVLYHYMRVPTHPMEGPVHLSITGFSAILFGLMAMVRYAPKDCVTRQRYQRFPVIPLKASQTSELKSHSVRIGAPAPRYAVIPRRDR